MIRVVVFSVFALVVFVFGTSASASAAGSCPSVRAHAKTQLEFRLGRGFDPTQSYAMYSVDIASNGSVSNVTVLRSSGDVRLDAAGAGAIAKNDYDAATRSCVAIGTAFAFQLNFRRPSSGGSAPPPPEIVDCDRAVNRAIVAPAPPGDPRRGSAHGRAIAKVLVDEHGVPTATLEQSTGDELLDAETLRVARESKYTIVTSTKCPVGPRTATIDLTFYTP